MATEVFRELGHGSVSVPWILVHRLQYNLVEVARQEAGKRPEVIDSPFALIRISSASFTLSSAVSYDDTRSHRLNLGDYSGDLPPSAVFEIIGVLVGEQPIE